MPPLPPEPTLRKAGELAQFGVGVGEGHADCRAAVGGGSGLWPLIVVFP